MEYDFAADLPEHLLPYSGYHTNLSLHGRKPSLDPKHSVINLYLGGDEVIELDPASYPNVRLINVRGVNLVLLGEFTGRVTYDQVDHAVPDKFCRGTVDLRVCTNIVPTGQPLEHLVAWTIRDFSNWTNVTKLSTLITTITPSRLPPDLIELVSNVNASLLEQCTSLRRFNGVIADDGEEAADLSHIEVLSLREPTRAILRPIQLYCRKLEFPNLNVDRLESLGCRSSDGLSEFTHLNIAVLCGDSTIPIEAINASRWHTLDVQHVNQIVSKKITSPHLRKLIAPTGLIEQLNTASCTDITISSCDNDIDSLKKLISRLNAKISLMSNAADLAKYLPVSQLRLVNYLGQDMIYTKSERDEILGNNRHLLICPSLSVAIFERDKALQEQTTASCTTDQDVNQLLFEWISDGYGKL